MKTLKITERQLDLLIASIEAHQGQFEQELNEDGDWDDLWDLRLELLELYQQRA